MRVCFFLIAFSVLLGLACSRSEPVSPDLSGTWAGETTQSLPVSLEIAALENGPAVVSLTFSITENDGLGPKRSDVERMAPNGLDRIEDDTFKILDGGSPSFILEGSVDDATAINGIITFSSGLMIGNMPLVTTVSYTLDRK